MKQKEIYPNVETTLERWTYVLFLLDIIIGIGAIVSGFVEGAAIGIVSGIAAVLLGFLFFTQMKILIKTSLYVVRINNMLESTLKNKED